MNVQSVINCLIATRAYSLHGHRDNRGNRGCIKCAFTVFYTASGPLCSFTFALLTQSNAEGNLLGSHHQLWRPGHCAEEKRGAQETEGATMTNHTFGSLVEQNANNWEISADTINVIKDRKVNVIFILCLQQWQQAFQGTPQKSVLSKNSLLSFALFHLHFRKSRYL